MVNEFVARHSSDFHESQMLSVMRIPPPTMPTRSANTAYLPREPIGARAITGAPIIPITGVRWMPLGVQAAIMAVMKTTSPKSGSREDQRAPEGKAAENGVR